MDRMMNEATFIKYTLKISNLVLMIYSLILIGLGVAVSLNCLALIELLPMGLKLIDSMPSWVPWMMFCVGLIMFLICILGFYGASNETYWTFVIYAILLIGVIILQVILGVLVYFRILFGQTPMQEFLTRVWPILNPPQNAPEEVYSAFYDKIRKSSFIEVLNVQEKFNCCGVYGKSDYSVYGKSLSVLVKSCCPAVIEKCTPDEAYDDGCKFKVDADYKSWLEWKLIIQGVAIGFVCLQVMLAALALYLAKSTRKSR